MRPPLERFGALRGVLGRSGMLRRRAHDAGGPRHVQGVGGLSDPRACTGPGPRRGPPHPARVLVLGNYGLEAWREAIDRRRAMLGDAAVAAVVSELSAAELARVERTIRMLDPEDLDTLTHLTRGVRDDEPALERFEDVEGERESDAEWRQRCLVLGHLGGAALVAAGCVQSNPFGRGRTRMEPEWKNLRPVGEAQITPLGDLVLRFMGRSE